NILLATDWHDQPEKLLTASANFPEPDLFLMLGDYASNYNSEDEFILNTIAAGADVTKSEIPAIYTRGNHETYGEMTELVFPGLGLDRFYYQTRRGDYLFTVCDSVDWAGERFDRSEYVRGTANSENDVYREEQLAWLESLQPGEEAFHFAAVHRPEFGGDDQRARFYGELERLGADMQFSGHEHALHLDAPGTGEYLPPCPLFVAGGPKDGSYSGLYVCSMAQVSAGGGVRLLAWDSANEQLMDETVR
ncbi:MAG: metallophosphoesterase, partial [Firmicutes bacterium]|nr:metallophosphoesterase [Bacillota bacterium]